MLIKKVPILSFLLGFAAIIVQAVILRVFQTVFYGNEFSYAIILASWLLWVGCGSVLAALISSKTRIQHNLLVMSFCALAFSIPGVIFGIRYIKVVLDILPGQMIGIVPMMICSFVLIAPIAFFVGALFVFLCHIAQGEDGDSSGKVYYIEAFGSAIGGMVFSFILLKLFNSTMIAWLMSVLVLVVLLVLYRLDRGKRTALIALLFFLLSFVALDMIYGLDYLSQQKQYPEGILIASHDSPYANITVIKQHDELSIYQNGLLNSTTNDLMTAEVNVHFPLLAHSNPQKVLLIGTGLGGELEEILEHPGTYVDFVEIDAQLIDVARKYLPQRKTDVLNDPRVRIYTLDARRFVRTTSKKYDVVIINVGDPYTAGLNRYYTLEFCQELAEILNVGGIVSFRVSSSENFLSEENRVFLRSLYETFKAVFSDVRSIPGDIHTFLVSDRAGFINLDSQKFIDRLLEAKLENRFVSEYTLPFLLNHRRISIVEDILQEEKGLINKDLVPRAYLFHLLLWSTHFDQGFKYVVERLQIPFWIVICLAASLISSISFWIFRRNKLKIVNLAIATTGFSEIVFEVVVILAFQSLYGIAYDKIGLILASFMFGLVAGSRWAVKLASGSMEQCFKVFKKIQAAVVVYPLLLPLLFVVFRDANFAQQWVGIFVFVFACLPFIAGFIGGMQYPLAIAIRKQITDEDESYSAGILYSFDVFGAAIGALITGAFLIPMYGIVAVCVLCAVINLVVLMFLLRVKRYS